MTHMQRLQCMGHVYGSGLRNGSLNRGSRGESPWERRIARLKSFAAMRHNTCIWFRSLCGSGYRCCSASLLNCLRRQLLRCIISIACWGTLVFLICYISCRRAMLLLMLNFWWYCTTVSCLLIPSNNGLHCSIFLTWHCVLQAAAVGERSVRRSGGGGAGGAERAGSL